MKSHCKNGHELTPDNLYVYETTRGIRRECATCKRATSAASQRRKNAKLREMRDKGLKPKPPTHRSSGKDLKVCMTMEQLEQELFEAMSWEKDDIRRRMRELAQCD